MILPTKHIRPDRALLAVGADVLGCLREPMTVYAIPRAQDLPEP